MFLNTVNQLIFVMVKCGVLFEARTEFLNIIYTSFGFRGLISLRFKEYFIKGRVSLSLCISHRLVSMISVSNTTIYCKLTQTRTLLLHNELDITIECQGSNGQNSQARYSKYESLQWSSELNRDKAQHCKQSAGLHKHTDKLTMDDRLPCRTCVLLYIVWTELNSQSASIVARLVARY
jgi:hypothetical protein